MMDEQLRQEVLHFKMELLGKLPFYGDILMNVLITEDDSVETSCTNGRVILYNADYLNRHSEAERNYILMHEVMHILMLHCARGAGKDARLFNAAADIIVNAELADLTSSMRRAGIEFKPPVEGIYADVGRDQTVENLYEMMLQDNQEEVPPAFGEQENRKKMENRGSRKQNRGGANRKQDQTGNNSVSRKPQTGGNDAEHSESMTGGNGTRSGNAAKHVESMTDVGEAQPGAGKKRSLASSLKSMLQSIFGGDAHSSPARQQPADAGRKALLRRSYESGLRLYASELPDDLVKGIPPEELEKEVAELLAHAAQVKERSPSGSYYVPPALYTMSSGRLLDWKAILGRLLEDRLTDEVSYATPERKYLHMDMILPGTGEREEELDRVWAFVDCSGSISHEEMDGFLTQLYGLAKAYRCRMSIAYWCTSVKDVYRDIRDADEIRSSLPKYSGGTDINCVYRYIRENRLKAEVFLILTDGCFGELEEENRIPALRRKTIVVLSGKEGDPAQIRQLGKAARLQAN